MRWGFCMSPEINQLDSVFLPILTCNDEVERQGSVARRSGSAKVARGIPDSLLSKMQAPGLKSDVR